MFHLLRQKVAVSGVDRGRLSTETEVLLSLGLIGVDCQIIKFWLIWILICLS